ncbi:MAG: hypothetical protein AAB631_00815 [Patescibacteria group bacterium]
MERREWTPKTALIILLICACITSIATALFQWFDLDAGILWIFYAVVALAIFRNIKFPPSGSSGHGPPPAI